MNYLSLPKALSLNKIPSALDVIQGFIYEKAKWMCDTGTQKEPAVSVISEKVVEKVQRIYRAARIKTIRKDKIKDKVIKLYNSRQTLLKISRSKRHKASFLNKKTVFESGMSKTFQVAASSVSSRKRKLSEKRDSNSKHVVRKCIATEKRPSALLSRQKTYAVVMQEEDVSGESVDMNEKDDSEYELPNQNKITPKTRLDLSDIVEVKSRYSSSCRELSAIVNATLRSMGLEPLVDKSMVRRAEKRKFAEIVKTPVNFHGGLYYDSRKDLSMFHKKKRTENGFKYFRVIKRQEHYSLVAEPGGIFLGFVNSQDGTAVNGSQAILSFLNDSELCEGLVALGSDGTNTNVGSDGGINHYIEQALQRPMHWFVCQLHLNELPLKKLIIKLDGETTGSDSFAGPIGKQLYNVCNLPIIGFKKFRKAKPLDKLPDEVFRKLSNDQKYLYNIINALISGEFSETLKHTNIGKINHSRWVTTASRICRLYAATKFPSDTLKTIVSYVVNVYAPTWFRIKKYELAINGPENLLFLIKKCKLITNEKAKSIVHKCISRNAFFAHSENVLLSQLASKEKPERVDAVQKILELRNRPPSNRIRRFRVPKINFEARSFTEMAAYNESSLFEPPLTQNMNKKELLSLIKRPLVTPKFKCHTQMVERAVKEVTRVSLKAIDHNQRNAMVKATLLNRAKFPKQDSLKDYFPRNCSDSNVYLPKI